MGLEILEQTEQSIDYIFIPVGGGGLASGLSTVFKTLSPKTKIIGVEPSGAPSMKMAIEPVSYTHLRAHETKTRISCFVLWL